MRKMKTLVKILSLLLIPCFLQSTEANQPCKQPFIKNGFYKSSHRPAKGYFRDGVVISYSCDRGYYLKGESKSKCVNGRWSSHLPQCIKACESPNHSIYKHEGYSSKLYKLGEKIHFNCIDNYYRPSHISYSSATCIGGGLWDQEPFTCYKYCENPDKYIGGDFTPKKPQYKYEEIVYYGCPKSRTKYLYAQCEKDGKWTQSKICLSYCKPRSLSHGDHSPMYKAYKFNDKVVFKCSNSYYLYPHKDEHYSMCQKNGHWNNELPVCKKYCEAPTHSIYYLQSFDKNLYKVGEKISLTCQHGYYAPGHIDYDYATCQENGLWDVVLFTCYKYCPPQTINNGLYTPIKHLYKYGDKLSYSCNEEYYLHYHTNTYDYNVCQKDGSWSYQPPVCYKYCKAPLYSEYYYAVDFEKSSYKFGEEINFVCSDGYHVPSHITYNSAICGSNGLWDQAPFVCHKYCKAPLYSEYYYANDFKKSLYKFGEEINFVCADEYYAPSHITYNSAICGSNGLWDQDPFVCYKYCNAPVYSEYYYANDFQKSLYKFGKKIDFVCADGYYAPSHIIYNSATCGSNGLWDQDPFACYKYCIAPSYAHYNFKPYDVNLYKFGETIKYECNDGYYAPNHIDYSHATCGTDGKWDKDAYKCYKYCFVPENYGHGMIHPNKIAFKAGEKAIFGCSHGYRLNANYNAVICNKSGLWLKKLPQCIRHQVVKIVRNKH